MCQKCQSGLNFHKKPRGATARDASIVARWKRKKNKKWTGGTNMSRHATRGPLPRLSRKKKKVGIWEVWHNTARPKEEDAGRNKVGLDSKAKQACVSGGK